MKAPKKPNPAPPSRDAVAARAHQMWEQEGCPHGRDVEHWLRAESDLIAACTAATAQATKARPPAAPARNRMSPLQQPQRPMVRV